MNFFAFGFAAVAISAVGAVDYLNQAQSAGQEPGAFGVGAYVGTFSQRFSDTRNAAALDERQRANAKSHLPQTPEGWEQRVFAPTEGGNDLHADLDGRTVTSDEVEDFLTAQTRKANRASAIREARAKTLEYQKGDQIVRLSATFDKPKDPGSVSDFATAMASAGINGVGGNWEGYAVVQGVPFFRNIHVGRTDLPEGGPVRLRLMAMIGQDVTLEVDSLATEPDLRGLLEQVDYAALNAMLNAPLTAIGPDAPAIAPEQQAAVAQLALEAMRNGQAAHLNDLQDRVLAMADAQAGQATPGAADTAGAAKPDSSAFKKLKGLFGGDARGSAEESGKADENKPGRISLSGGTSCLEGSAGRFCRD
ncbi:hypothetical protein OO012_18535 [Rhodobacteraceae bacterium KMM 6894]|nr:hypothetical protein [Rhodobacteraceae bacterium KMM 6894]